MKCRAFLHWIIGIAVSAAGVAAARLTGDHPANAAGVVIHIAGLLLAGAGLIVIALGVNRGIVKH